MTETLWKIPREVNKRLGGVTLLELFFDVILVAAVGAAVQGLAHNFEELHTSSKNTIENIHHIVFVLVQIITILFIWRCYTIYSSRYGNGGIRHRVLTLILMLGLSLMCVGEYLQDTQSGSSKNIILLNSLISGIGVVLSIFLLAYLYLTAGIYANKYEKQYLYTTAFGRIVNIILMIITFVIYFQNTNLTYWIAIGIWAGALITWIIFDWKAKGKKWFANTPFINRELIQERYSILFIVFVGELFIRITSGIAEKIVSNTDDLSGIGKNIGLLIVSFLTLFSWWWFFKDVCNYPNIINHPRTVYVYTNAMLGILMSLVFSAVGIEIILDDVTKTYGKWFLFGGVAFWHIATSVTEYTLRPYKRKEKYLQPIWYIRSIKSSWLIFLTWGWSIFIPGVNGEVWLYITMSLALTYIAALMVVRINAHKNRKGIRKNYVKYMMHLASRRSKFVEQTVVPYLDYNHHKKYNFEINEFSKMVKKNKTNH